MSDLISRQDAIKVFIRWEQKEFGYLDLNRGERLIDALYELPSADRPFMTEKVREAIMRLTMCAREECSICKYVNDCGFDKQCEMATENMNTITNAFKESADRSTMRGEEEDE